MANPFGVLLRDARRRAGLTQDDLAARSGVGVRTIRRLETGSGTDPRIGTVTLLADALDVGADGRHDLLAAADGRYRRPAELAVDGSPVPGPDEPVPGEPVPDDAVVPGRPATETPGTAPSSTLPTVPREVSDAADDLARVVATRLHREEELRRVHDPVPLPVRWLAAPGRIVDHWDNICRVPAGVTAAPLDLSGGTGDIAAVHRSVPSRRMVVLGRAGSGKTVLTLRFVLDTIADREPGGAVPVIFNIGSWNPATTPLRTWLVRMLERDHPGLAAPAPGGATRAAVLVDSARILPVLDGFDEIAEGLRRPALETLNAVSMPLLMTSRFGEYERAVTDVDVLTSAAVVELADLTPDDLAGYLPRTARRLTGNGGGTAWDPVIDALQENDSGVTSPVDDLAAVLTTPLMVGLARVVYSDARDRDPADLLDPDRFPTAASIEEHLLDSFVPSVYNGQSENTLTPSWDMDRVRRWLGFLAADLDRRGTGDLEWWNLSGALSRTRRVLLVTVFAFLVSGLLFGGVFSPVLAIARGTPLSLDVILVDGLANAPLIGLPACVLYLLLVARHDKVIEPTRVRVRLADRAGRQRGLRRKLLSRFVGGALGGAMAGVGLAIVNAALRLVRSASHATIPIDEQLSIILVDAAVYSIAFSVVGACSFALAAFLETPANLTTTTSPADLLTANRSTALRLAGVLSVLLALAITFGVLAVIRLAELLAGPFPSLLIWSIPAGLLVGAISAACIGLTYIVAFTAWGHWLLFTRFRLPLIGRLPWSVKRFLEDAYGLGVLRQSGAVYQFRHARLQEHLAKAYRAGR